MSSYIIPIKVALIVFPILAFFLTLPYMFVQYRKYGSIPHIRSIIIYSFIFYLLCIYFLVILPLPSISEVSNLTKPYTQLIPFNFIKDFLRETSLVITDTKTYLTALIEPGFYNVLFNLIMFVPLGIYLRYYFKLNIKKVFILSLLLSLFFELTQLSGLYFIYPRPYRLFDVDDLILNTCGGLLGCLIGGGVNKILPTRDKIDAKAYQDGKKVSLGRRLLAWLIDFIIITIIISLLNLFVNAFDNALSPFILILYFSVTSILLKGQTFGKKALKIRVVNENNEKGIKYYQYLIRYILLYLVFVPAPLYSLLFFIYGFNDNILFIFIILIISFFFMILSFKFYFGALIYFFDRDKILLHEVLSKTKLVSTINIEFDIKVDEE